MAKDRITAPVGLQPRESEGKPVKNKPADVLLLRKMLEANGIGPLGDATSMDKGLLKAISRFQKKMGHKWPDQVVDPGGQTETALLKKYKALAKEEAKIALVEVKYRGKVLQLTQKDYDKMVAEVFQTLERYIKSLISHHKTMLDIYQDYLDTAQLKDGLLNAVAQAIIIKAGSVKMPKSSVVGKSIAATGKLERAVMSKNLEMLDTALPEAEAAINAFNAEISRFLKDFTGSAQTTATVLCVSSAACFAIVGALAAPVLVTGAGMSAGAAAVTSGAGVAVLQSGTQELAKHASGQKVTVWDSVQAVVIDGTIGGLTGGIGAKIPLGFCDDIGKAMATRLGSTVGFMSKAQLQKFIANYIAGSGQEVIKSAIGEGIKLCGTMAKTGKTPTEKDFMAAVEAVVYSALLGGMVKNPGSFQKKFAMKHRDMLQGQIFDKRLASLAKKNDIPPVLKAKLWAEVANKVSDEALKVGHHAVFERATGNESEKQMLDIAEKAILSDKALQKLIDKEIEAALKKHGALAK